MTEKPEIKAIDDRALFPDATPAPRDSADRQRERLLDLIAENAGIGAACFVFMPDEGASRCMNFVAHGVLTTAHLRDAAAFLEATADRIEAGLGVVARVS